MIARGRGGPRGGENIRGSIRGGTDMIMRGDRVRGGRGIPSDRGAMRTRGGRGEPEHEEE
jgi:hypothetical protein